MLLSKERLDPWIVERSDDLLGFVGGAVVKDDEFPILVRLRKHAFNGLLDLKLTIEVGHDDADQRFIIVFHLIFLHIFEALFKPPGPATFRMNFLIVFFNALSANTCLLSELPWLIKSR